MFDRYGAGGESGTADGERPIRVRCIGPDAAAVADRLEAERAQFATSTATGVGAAEALATDTIDCVVSDHDPPHLDGVALLERVRRVDDSLPFVLFTAHGDEATAGAAVNNNASGYISKGDSADESALLADYIETAVEKHREETELTEQRSGLRLAETLFNNTQDALFVVDVTDEPFRIKRVNPAYEQLSGLSNERLSGRTLTETFGEQEGGAIIEKYRTCVEAREPIEYEEEVSVPSAGPYWETRISPVIVDDRVEGLVGATRNISERKREQQALERTSEFLRQIQRVADIGGWEIDERSGRVRWTEELYRIHGRSREYEPTVTDSVDFYHPDDRPTIETAYERLLTEGEPYDLELRLRTETGDRRWARSRGEPWYDGDERVGARGTLQDITERKEREAELRLTNARLDEFASVVSHDLRNPLVVAKGSLDLYRKRGTQADYDRVAAAHERIGALITDLLTLAREGQQVTETATLTLETQVSMAFDMIPSDDATLDLAVGEYTLRADEARLRQLLDNLLSNAVEHGSTSPDSQARQDAVRHGGPGVTVRVGLLDDGAGFYVADDGPGIPAANRDDVFEHGYSTGSEGTGLGLAIVRGIAAAHGWQVGVTESADGGARFEVHTG